MHRRVRVLQLALLMLMLAAFPAVTAASQSAVRGVGASSSHGRLVCGRTFQEFYVDHAHVSGQLNGMPIVAMDTRIFVGEDPGSVSVIVNAWTSKGVIFSIEGSGQLSCGTRLITVKGFWSHVVTTFPGEQPPDFPVDARYGWIAIVVLRHAPASTINVVLASTAPSS